MLSCGAFTVRVLFWSELYWPHIGGAEIFARDLIRALTARGHTIEVVTSQAGADRPAEEYVDDVVVHRFPFRSWLDGNLDAFRASLKGVAALKARMRPDLVHMNAVGPSALFHLRTQGAARAPLLLTLQQQVLDSQAAGGATLLAETLRAAGWVTGCSEAALAQACRVAEGVDARSSVIWNGIPAPALSPAPLPIDPPRLLCLGRLVPAKGVDIALEAFARVRATYAGLRLDIAGDGPERAALEQRAARLGLGGDVRFLGWVDPAGVYDVLNRATLVLMPSRREGLPLVSVQAAHMGRPVVGARVGGLPEVVLDGETGRLVPSDDLDALTAAIDALLADNAAARRLGAAALARARRLFDWDSTVGRYDTLYRQLAPDAGRESRQGAA
jgi:glycosyltransferase involved in cell wall biosynthesis